MGRGLRARAAGGGTVRSLPTRGARERCSALFVRAAQPHMAPLPRPSSPFLVFYVPPVQHSTRSTYMMPLVINPSRVTMDSITCVTKMPPSSVPNQSIGRILPYAEESTGPKSVGRFAVAACVGVEICLSAS